MLESLIVVLLIGAIAWIGSAIGLTAVFGIVLPYVAVCVFVVGLVRRMIYWAKSPVPFAIPTTGGQEHSLDFIKQDKFDCPNTKWGVFVRMVLEVLLFRSLFRNTRAISFENDPVNNGPRVVYYSSKWLWFFALLFHYCFFLVFLRHFRFFMEPVPACISFVEAVDGVLQIGSPRFFLTGGILLVAILFLLARRIFDQRLRYISLINDYFPLWLLLGIVISGLYLRYFDKAEIAQVKIFIMGLTHFSPVISNLDLNGIFIVHLTLVSTLLIYFPFSKLVHMPGVFFSPTRNLPTNTREVRHINPWNPPSQFFTYPEYEDRYREAMAEAGLPLEKQPKPAE
ncbi:MAG: sulfate reduction electron transfer complex DsrMKJOP subunit DsrM [Desulfovibrionaceae bacterium]|nr:sulfate reduction electron transfer complex DsrMKJOP subunit DsrM [Desulfovibrionaceae bacterium]